LLLGLPKPGLEYQRISIDRSKLSEDEAFEHAIEMISSRQMGFRKAADFFQVSKWKLYKTARKRGIYAEIKKQNQAHAISKVPTNVQHFAELGVYKQMRKKLPNGEKDLFPHLPRQTFAMGDDPKILKTFTNLHVNNNNIANNNNNNNNLSMKNANTSNLNIKNGYVKPEKNGYVKQEKNGYVNQEKNSFVKQEMNFDKRYEEPIKPYESHGKPMDLKQFETKTLTHPISSSYDKTYHVLEEPIKLVKPISRSDDHEEEEDDDDDRLLVIAHRENGNHEDSENESSERAEDSV